MAALEAVGGWDPFNVTEDADLGMRLARAGHGFAVIRRPTYEDAPTAIPEWLGQRSRWFKGWLQTWLVMMRQPVANARRFGPVGFAVSQIVTAGMLLSALLSPLMLYFVSTSLWRLINETEPYTIAGYMLLGFDLIVLFGTFVAFLWLGLRSMTFREKLRLRLRWLWLPIYWCLMSYAAWRAFIELFVRPFHWQKTPHRPAASACKAHSEPA